MKNQSKLAILALAVCFASCKKTAITTEEEISGSSKQSAKTAAVTATYYVDNVNGNDGNNGLSTTTAWKNISKVNSVTFAPGNQILFKAGGSWTNRLAPAGSGTSGSPIVIGSYGSGAKPKINGAGVANGTICLTNQEYWEIRDIEVTNYNASEEGGISLATWESNNLSNYANATLPAQAVNNNTAKLGILVTASDMGQVDHIYLQNVTIHGVNGTIDQDDEGSKENGGLAFRITGTGTQTWYNDILVENCTFTHIDRTGAFTSSTWDDRTFTSNTNWKPGLNIIFRNNTFSNIGANAMIVRVADHPLMEHNLFDHCAIKISGNAAFNFNTDYAKWQYNECRFTKANIDDRDAGGLDADYKTKNTIIQYNYLHDNDYGMLITGGGNSFNDQTQVKYNIIENDGKYAHPSNGKFAVKVAGATTNAQIYNNVINSQAGWTNYNIVVHSQWTVWPSNTSYYNNIIRNAAASSAYVFGGSTGNVFDYNIFNMNTATNQPSQVHNVTGLVKFVNPGAGDPNGYKLQSGSVALLAGKVITGNGGKDYFGNPVSSTTAPNIGAYNGAGL
ncbi:hypothetical protein [Hufsiella ginkgonis]|uniref:Right-handed parallel beta-helix repeat-containing protein n=1 Tax=Hufsiella ginkgonis TaxID=2695274 RepID=A0A7K1XXV5_9SPHI|nr:hypothetical protein [Hufsiella ginkgonis]MXV15782.1 hypothetical protein [Hufsiella ginkgonis]